MKALEELLGLILAAVLLAAAARRVGAPYPVFLALGGALLAFLPGAPPFTVPPELALALFVAPVLLDAAYDTSTRDLRDNWLPVTSLAVVAVCLTSVAVAVVARMLMPAIAWAPAIALGAVVAPPDAAAATAVLRPLRPPRRILTILEGESLLNDASALLIYRLAVGAVAVHGFSIDDDPVGHEVAAARERALRAGLSRLDRDRSPVAAAVRQEFAAHLGSTHVEPEEGEARRPTHSEIHREALQAARQAVLAMRATDEIGDDAFHQMEQELDWLEMADGSKAE
jgi:hypothetical protein